MTAPTTPPKRRGRPPTGKALTGAERQARHEQCLREAGVRRVSVTLTPDDDAALARVRERDGHDTDQSAIVASVHAHADKPKKPAPPFRRLKP